MAAENARNEALHRGDGVLLVGAAAVESGEGIGHLFGLSLLCSQPLSGLVQKHRLADPRGAAHPKHTTVGSVDPSRE